MKECEVKGGFTQESLAQISQYKLGKLEIIN